MLSKILYLPCLASIWKHVGQSSCYKLMLLMGVQDIVHLGSHMLMGWLQITGTVFCSSPKLLFVFGCFHVCEFTDVI